MLHALVSKNSDAFDSIEIGLPEADSSVVVAFF